MPLPPTADSLFEVGVWRLQVPFEGGVRKHLTFGGSSNPAVVLRQIVRELLFNELPVAVRRVLVVKPSDPASNGDMKRPTATEIVPGLLREWQSETSGRVRACGALFRSLFACVPLALPVRVSVEAVAGGMKPFGIRLTKFAQAWIDDTVKVEPSTGPFELNRGPTKLPLDWIHMDIIDAMRFLPGKRDFDQPLHLPAVDCQQR